MAVMVTPTAALEGPAAVAGARVLGRITIPGRGEQVRVARTFAAGVLGELAGLDDGVLHDAMLLTSELVTNAIRHSRSGAAGGSVLLVILQAGDGIGVEVSDGGSADGTPVVKEDVLTCEGHGLFLVEAVASHWGYRRAEEDGTTVWFWLDLSTA
jgi:serine/threonine-protein kinase RsbW